MSQVPGLLARPLHQITLPGSHDAGCYTNTWWALQARTQTQNLFGQLGGGVRYFDLRPCKSGDEFWTYHGPYYGGRLDGPAGILQQVNAFMNVLAAADRELVILNISHFYGTFTAADHHRLIAEIQGVLGPHLLPHSQGGVNLFDVPYGNLLADAVGNSQSRVAILYDGAFDTARQNLCAALPPGFFKLTPKYAVQPAANAISVFDQYANQRNVPPMQADQMNKLTNRAAYNYSDAGWGAFPWVPGAPNGVPGVMHLFSWTLTPQPFGGPLAAAQNLSNPALEGAFTGNNWGGAARAYDPHIDPMINIVYVDDYFSQQVANPASPRDGWAMPVAISDFINQNFNPLAAWPGWGGF